MSAGQPRSEKEREMRKIMLMAAALMVGALGLHQATAQQSQQQGSAEGMKVTGMVTEADKTTNEITIGD
jgi:hypothetical protein